VGEVVVYAIFPFFYLDFFIRGIAAAVTVRVTGDSEFQEAYKVRFVSGRAERGKWEVLWEDSIAGCEGVKGVSFAIVDHTGGHICDEYILATTH
jgi:hypothetical protein